MKLEILENGNYYHIFNRGINGETIFKNDDNKFYFLNLVRKHLNNKVVVLGYCLMDNHFHFLVEIISETKQANQSISNLFNAYAKAFNKQQNRTGSLFEKHFRRKKIDTKAYLKNVILYIHTNPQNHKITNYYKAYEFSSFRFYANDTLKSIVPINKSYILQQFDDINNFIFAHNDYLSLPDNDLGTDLQGFKKPRRSRNYY